MVFRPLPRQPAKPMAQARSGGVSAGHCDGLGQTFYRPNNVVPITKDDNAGTAGEED